MKKQTRRRNAKGRFLPNAAKAAAAALAGASTSEIAAELGISRTQAWRTLRSEECQQIIIDVVNRHASLLSSLFTDSLQVIRQAMQADRPAMTLKDGARLEGGPDHYARLAAVARLLQVFVAGRPKPKPLEEQRADGTFTLGEFEAQLGPDAGSSRTRAPQ